MHDRGWTISSWWKRFARRGSFFAVAGLLLANPAPPSSARPVPRLAYRGLDCLAPSSPQCTPHPIALVVTAPPAPEPAAAAQARGAAQPVSPPEAQVQAEAQVQTVAEAGTMAPPAASEAAAAEPPPPPDPAHGVHVLISLPQQKAWVFKDGTLLDTSPVSTGRKGRETPTGNFPILQKKKRHFSNLYGNAPMPYMQRLTWGGVAMHAGYLPGYPASHGCIRMPRSFAKKLYGLTNFSSRVTVTRKSPKSAEEAFELV